MCSERLRLPLRRQDLRFFSPRCGTCPHICDGFSYQSPFASYSEVLGMMTDSSSKRSKTKHPFLLPPTETLAFFFFSPKILYR